MLERSYSSREEIPAGWEHLYSEANGEWVLKSAGDIKAPGDVANVQEALRKEREEHAATKTKLASFGDLDPNKVREDLDKIDEYKLAAEGKLDDSQIDSIVEARIKTRVAPLERQITNLTNERDTFSSQVGELTEKDNRRQITDFVREAGKKANLTDGGLEDALFMAPHVLTITDDGKVVTKENSGVTPNVDPDTWLSDMKGIRPHWWGPSQGAGASGSGPTGAGADNPFTAENFNVTKQAQMAKSDPAKAANMAKAAGSAGVGHMPVQKK